MKDLLENETDVFNSSYDNKDFSLCEIKTKKLTDVTFNKCTFIKGKFDNVIFDKVIFKDCDLSNCFFDDCAFHNSSFINCKMIGVTINDGLINSSTIEDSLCKYLNFTEMKFNKFLISTSDLTESRFILVKLNDIIFDKDNLTKAEFNNTSLEKVDLSSCDIHNIDVDVYHVRGAIINESQAADLVNLLGVKIK
jgi:uncharacterized protein YjbI with pentapeptide repeats